MLKQAIQSPDAPAAIGPYSQAILVGNTLYMSGQIPLEPKTMQIVEGIDAQAHQVFRNLRAVAVAAGATLNDIAKLTIPSSIVGATKTASSAGGRDLNGCQNVPNDVPWFHPTNTGIPGVD